MKIIRALIEKLPVFRRGEEKREEIYIEEEEQAWEMENIEAYMKSKEQERGE